MEKTYTVKEVFNRCVELLEEGKGFWEMEIETKAGERLKDVQVVAIKPEGETLTCLFG